MNNKAANNTNDNHIPILRTKLHVPTIRPNTIPRNSLIKKLKDKPDCNLTIISAPAGYGKTTFICNWLNKSDRKIAWYSIDDTVNDLVPFLTYFIAALETLAPSIGKSSLSLLKTSKA